MLCYKSYEFIPQFFELKYIWNQHVIVSILNFPKFNEFSILKGFPIFLQNGVSQNRLMYYWLIWDNLMYNVCDHYEIQNGWLQQQQPIWQCQWNFKLCCMCVPFLKLEEMFQNSSKKKLKNYRSNFVLHWISMNV